MVVTAATMGGVFPAHPRVHTPRTAPHRTTPSAGSGRAWTRTSLCHAAFSCVVILSPATGEHGQFIDHQPRHSAGATELDCSSDRE
eukprot:2990416-Prymnesium_polylepis.1